MEVRFARHTDNLDALVAFYRDGLGLHEIGGFEDHAGYDGVFLRIPGAEAHLEFTTGGEHSAPVPHPETLLVLYVGNRDAVDEICARLASAPIKAANPFWNQRATTLVDPDGFHVVLVPHEWKSA